MLHVTSGQRGFWHRPRHSLHAVWLRVSGLLNRPFRDSCKEKFGRKLHILWWNMFIRGLHLLLRLVKREILRLRFFNFLGVGGHRHLYLLRQLLPLFCCCLFQLWLSLRRLRGFCLCEAGITVAGLPWGSSVLIGSRESRLSLGSVCALCTFAGCVRRRRSHGLLALECSTGSS